jgi:hypothetical protein
LLKRLEACKAMNPQQLIGGSPQGVNYLTLYRSLAARVWFVRWSILLLTETDVALSLLLTILTAIAIQALGLMGSTIGGVGLEPWGWISTGVAAILLLSAGNHLRPMGNNELIIKGLLAKQILVPRLDRYWQPSTAKLANLDRDCHSLVEDDCHSLVDGEIHQVFPEGHLSNKENRL